MSVEAALTTPSNREGAETRRKMDELSGRIIGGAIEVHRALGPGLLESMYEECLSHEMSLQGMTFERQKPLPIVYKGVEMECGYRIDFLVQEQVVVEIKVVDALHPIHHAQLLTYLKVGSWQIGLLINFNVPVLKRGLQRVVLNYSDPSAPPRLRGEQFYGPQDR
jgi:GxxExxY protein